MKALRILTLAALMLVGCGYHDTEPATRPAIVEPTPTPEAIGIDAWQNSRLDDLERRLLNAERDLAVLVDLEHGRSDGGAFGFLTQGTWDTLDADAGRPQTEWRWPESIH